MATRYNTVNMTHPTAQGRQLNIGVTFLAWLNIYQGLKQAIQDVIAPEIQSLRGDIRAQNGEIKALSAEVRALRQNLETLNKRVDDLAYEWRQSLDIRERLAVTSRDIKSPSE